MKAYIPEEKVTLEMTVAEALEVMDFAQEAFEETRSRTIGLLGAEIGAALEDAGYEITEEAEEAVGEPGEPPTLGEILTRMFSPECDDPDCPLHGPGLVDA